MSEIQNKLDRNEFIDVLVALRTLSNDYSVSAQNARDRGVVDVATRWQADSDRVSALYTKLADVDSISYSRKS